MFANNLVGLIRTQRDCFETPNIYAPLQGDMVEVHLANFRENKQDREFVLFYEFEGELYFPAWFEFRSINNNLLFLIKEYQIDHFKDLKSILLSSLDKEEHYTADIKAMVYHTRRMPRFALHLPTFQFESEDRIDIIESLSD